MAGSSAEPHPHRASRRPRRAWLWGLLALSLLGCSGPPSQVTGADLPEIQKRGVLRVLVPRHHLPQVLPADLPRPDQAFAAQFARELGLKVQWIYTDNRDNLIPLLLAGVGDLVGTGLAITPERREQAAFSVPLGVMREQVVVRADMADKVAGTPDLHDLTVAVHPSSAAWRRLELLQEEIPGLDLAALPESQTLGKTLDQVADGFYDATVLPSNLSEALLVNRPELKGAFYLGNERPVAWAVHPGAKALRTALDRFIYAHRLTESPPETYVANLAEIKKRGVLRVLTRNNPATFFLLRGERLGFEYELVRTFARSQGLRVEMVIPPSRDALIPWLEQGRGDLIAASLTITPERRKIADIAFSRPYNYATETVVSRATETPITSPRALAGREIVVRHSSSYWETIRKLQAQGIPVKLKAAPEEQETEWIIGQVAEGSYDLTVADSPLLDIERIWRDDIRGDLTLGKPVPHGWAVRRNDPELLKAVNGFLDGFYRSTDYNLIYRKYFRNPREILHHVEQRTARSGNLSPYDDTVRRYADEFGFDWRLIVAVMHQESRFDPDAQSWTGATGLMQIMPRTARELGVEDRHDEESSIQAGIRYLAQLRQRFDPEIPLVERTWMALAAYNAGFGHVEDARRLAKSQKLDPDRWDGNVEQAMRLLASSKYASAAEHGYCRCNESVHYVQQIRARYDAYVNVTGATAVAGNMPLPPDSTPGVETLADDESESLVEPAPEPERQAPATAAKPAHEAPAKTAVKTQDKPKQPAKAAAAPKRPAETAKAPAKPAAPPAAKSKDAPRAPVASAPKPAHEDTPAKTDVAIDAPAKPAPPAAAKPKDAPRAPVAIAPKPDHEDTPAKTDVAAGAPKGGTPASIAKQEKSGPEAADKADEAAEATPKAAGTATAKDTSETARSTGDNTPPVAETEADKATKSSAVAAKTASTDAEESAAPAVAETEKATTENAKDATAETPSEGAETPTGPAQEAREHPPAPPPPAAVEAPAEGPAVGATSESKGALTAAGGG